MNSFDNFLFVIFVSTETEKEHKRVSELSNAWCRNRKPRPKPKPKPSQKWRQNQKKIKRRTRSRPRGPRLLIKN